MYYRGASRPYPARAARAARGVDCQGLAGCWQPNTVFGRSLVGPDTDDALPSDGAAQHGNVEALSVSAGVVFSYRQANIFTRLDRCSKQLSIFDPIILISPSASDNNKSFTENMKTHMVAKVPIDVITAAR